jgi:predicted permease
MFSRWRHRSFEQEMSDELNAHVAHRADDLEASGLSRADAERQARIELGAVQRHKEAIRDERLFGRTRRFLDQSGRDLRHGFLRLVRAPIYTLFAVASIGVGAGITTTVFALLQDTFWPTTGISRPGDVLLVANRIPRTAQWDRAMSLDDFDEYRRSQTSFQSLIAAVKFSHSLSLDSGTVFVSGEAVTEGYFQSLGVQAALGRVLQPADEQSGAPSVMLLSDSIWRRLFASDPDAVGKVVRFGGVPFEIVGVVARDYRGLNARPPRATGVWISLHAKGRLAPYGAVADVLASRQNLSLTVAGRLADGTSTARANTEAAAFSAGLDATSPITTTGWDGAQAVRIPAQRQWVVRQVDYIETAGLLPAVLILGLVTLVLLVACTNLANLALARGAARKTDLAIRLALGASRSRLIRELCAESAIIGAVGFALAVLISRALMQLASIDLPIFNGQSTPFDPHLNFPVLVVAAFGVGLALLVFGLWPALRLSRKPDLRSMFAGESGAAPSWRTERILIRLQVAASVTLFCAAAVFISALIGQVGRHPGVDLDRMTVARTVFRLQAWDNAKGLAAAEAVAAVAPGRFGFESVALSSSMPFGANGYTYASVGLSAEAAAANNATLLLAATPGILDSLGVPLVTGRAFDQRDVAGSEPVIVLSETSARTLFGTTSAVGREVFIRGMLNTLDSKTIERRRVIGIARDTDVGSMTKRGEGLAYVPLAQRYEPPNYIVGRLAGDATGDLRGLIRAADPDVAVDAIGSGLVMLGGNWIGARILAGVALLLGGITLALTTSGLYGVLSALVLRRSREIAIRKAMGADNSRIRRMVLRDGARPVLSGTLIGLMLGVLAGFLIRAALPASGPSLTLVVLGIVLVAVVPTTLAACELPARRAMRVDPNVALKDA